MGVTVREISEICKAELKKWREDHSYNLMEGYKREFLKRHPEYEDKPERKNMR